VLEAAWFGVPLVCIPVDAEQFYNAAVVEYRQIGVALDHTKVTKGAATILTTIVEVLDGESRYAILGGFLFFLLMTNNRIKRTINRWKRTK
jgi:UDP:flavonoid glycosyltransferase YjiC (YdhE family)